MNSACLQEPIYTSPPIMEAKLVANLEIVCATLPCLANTACADRFRAGPWGICVTDGMNGEPAGEVYAELSANLIARSLEEGYAEETSLLQGVNHSLMALGSSVLRSRGGATACLCAFGKKPGEPLRLASTGDVRAFLCEGKALHCLCGSSIGPERSGPYLGDTQFRREGICKLAKLKLSVATLLMCTDGFWRYAPESEIAAILENAPRLTDAATELLRLARSCGSSDDATVAVCRAAR